MRNSSERAFAERDKTLMRGDGDLFPPVECCWVCGNETGKAGRAEDSFYGDDDDGPYCEECWDEKQRQDKEREDA